MRFFLGDDNGQLKSVQCTRIHGKDWKVNVDLLDDGGTPGKNRAIQQLAVQPNKIVVARRDGSGALFVVDEQAESARVVQQWQETRLKPGEDQFVGLSLTTDSQVMSCTSAGHLRLTHTGAPMEYVTESRAQTTWVPNRLRDWVLSGDAQSFAYGGDEVEVSVWDTSRAFNPSRRLLPSSAAGSKRRKGERSELIEGEIWRARNVSNDSLGLRQPVHNTSLVYLSPQSNGIPAYHHILAGTQLGSVRRYDTRAARKPIADWKDVGRIGGIRKVQNGNSGNEAFIADYGGNLVALDLRTGRVLYTYKGSAGAISSICPTTYSLSPPLLVSTSLDRYFRLYSTHDTPQKTDGPMDQKGDILAEFWMKSAPTCVAWNGRVSREHSRDGVVDSEDEEERDIWAGMRNVGEGDTDMSRSLIVENENEDNMQKPKKRRV